MSEQEENYQPGREKTDEEKLKERDALVNDIENVGQAMQRLHKCTLNKNGGSYHYLIQALLFRLHELGFLEGLRQVSQNMITWHDPKEKPKSEKSQILVVKYPEREPWWIRAWWQDNQWYSCDDGVEVPDHYIVKWGSFELEIEEVEGE